jgi:hypothetical protein
VRFNVGHPRDLGIEPWGVPRGVPESNGKRLEHKHLELGEGAGVARGPHFRESCTAVSSEYVASRSRIGGL